MKRDKLFEVPLEEESFEEQMNDLGVEVVKLKPEVEWYNSRVRTDTGDLKNKVNLNNSCLTIGVEVAKILGEGARLKVAVVKTKKINGPDEVTFALKHEVDGLKIAKSPSGSYRLGGKKMSEWLLGKGVKKGKYELKSVDGWYKAVPVAGGEE